MALAKVGPYTKPGLKPPKRPAAPTLLDPKIFGMFQHTRHMLGLPELPASLKAPPPLSSLPPGLALPGTAGGGVQPRHFKGNDPIAVIANNAHRMGLDPAAVLAYALEESGARWGAVGDNGTSFGPFQAHIGGANPYSDPKQAAAWANSPKGLIQMMGMMARTPAKGLTGHDAVMAIYKYFGKGTPTAIPKGLAQYDQAVQLLGSAHPLNGQTTAPANVRKWVTIASGAARPGVPVNPMVPAFVAQVAAVYGQRLEIGTTTNHRQYVSGEGHTQSDHWTGDAADIPMTGAALTRLGRAALIAAGANRKWAMKQTSYVGTINGYNILFNTNVGGNHFNHLHVGLGRRPGSNRSRGRM